MSPHRRLTRMERSLRARDAILLWLEEARRYPDLAAYARSLVAADAPLSALDVIFDRVWMAAFARATGTVEERSTLARGAIRDATFLYELVLGLNESAMRFAELTSLRGLLAGRWMGDYLEDGTDLERRARWDRWRDETAHLVLQARTEAAAWALLERRYFMGRCVLFATPAEDWGRASEQIELLATLVDTTPASLRVRGRGARARPLWPSVDSVAARAAELVEGARITAFEVLGEPSRARAIVEGRLRASR